MPMLSVGRIVRYVPETGNDFAAIVTAVIPTLVPPETANLAVFVGDDAAPVKQENLVEYSEDPKPGTWHWPPSA